MAESKIQQRYKEQKAKHPDALLLFRCGDFYETYDTDASAVAAILGITLTKRNTKEQGFQMNMAGFPYHALDTYLPKLIRAGKRVAICDLIEDEQPAPKTKVTRVSTSTKPKNKEEMTQQEHDAKVAEITEAKNKEINDIKASAKAKDIVIATATVKALGSNIPSGLNAFLADAIGKLELIKIKHRQGVKPFTDEMNYLISMTQKAIDANL